MEPALPRKQRCWECWLAAQPITIRIPEAEKRLALVPPHLRRTRVAEKDWPEGRRFCAGCQSFVRKSDCPPSGSRCTTCSSIASHNARIMKQYGITPDEWNRLMNTQHGRCAICENPPKQKRLAVDHDHHTGAVRGLLCSRCNDELLGAAYHKIEVLQAAVRYLQTPPASGLWVSPAVLRGEPEPPPF